MNIMCTKVVAEQIKDFGSSMVEIDGFYEWSLHKIIANRRNTLLLMHNQSKYCLVLCNISKKTLSDPEMILQESIRVAMLDLLISPEIVEKYLKDAQHFSYSQLKDRHALGHLNQYSQELKYRFSLLLEPKLILQSEVTRFLNNTFIRYSKTEFGKPEDKLIDLLKEHYHEEAISTMAYTYKCTLDLGDEKVVRTFTIPSYYNFRQLHKTIQIVFNWKDSHLYEFIIKRNHYVKSAKIISIYNEPSEDFGELMDFVTPVSFYERADKIEYVYDMGDYWEHTLELIETLDDYHFNYPICIGGEGNTPPEDVGGVGGYQRYKEIMANPNHPEYDELNDWIGHASTHVFDIEYINHLLRWTIKGDRYLYDINA